MTSIRSSWRQGYVKTFVMTSKVRHDVTSTSWRKKRHYVKTFVKKSKNTLLLKQEASRPNSSAFYLGIYVWIHMKSWPKVELYKVVGQLSKPLAYTMESHIWSLLAPIQMKSWSKVISSCNQFEHFSKSLV